MRQTEISMKMLEIGLEAASEAASVLGLGGQPVGPEARESDTPDKQQMPRSFMLSCVL